MDEEKTLNKHELKELRILRGKLQQIYREFDEEFVKNLISQEHGLINSLIIKNEQRSN